MTLRPVDDIIASRPDGAVAFAGDEGNLMLQDGAKAVFRGGVTSQTGDFDIKEEDVVSGDIVIPLDDVGGASLINATVYSLGDPNDPDYDPTPESNPTNASRDFNVFVEDLTKDADVENPDPSNVLDRRRPTSGDAVQRTRLALGLFSDNGRIVIEHDELDVGENQINASFNIQSGSTDALQIRGPDGTIVNPAGDEALSSIGDGLSDVAAAVADARVALNELEPAGPNAATGDVLAKLDTRSASTITVSIDSPNPIDVRVDTSPDDSKWFENATTQDGSVDTDLLGVTNHRDNFKTGSRYTRVVLTGLADTETLADISIESSG